MVEKSEIRNYVQALSALGSIDDKGKYTPNKLENPVLLALAVDGLKYLERVDPQTKEGREAFGLATGINPDSVPNYQIRSFSTLVLRGGRSDLRASVGANLETLAGIFDSSNLAYETCPENKVKDAPENYEMARVPILEASSTIAAINRDPKKFVEAAIKNLKGTGLESYIGRYAGEFLEYELSGNETRRREALAVSGGPAKFLTTTYKLVGGDVADIIADSVRDGAYASIKQRMTAAEKASKEEPKTD